MFNANKHGEHKFLNNNLISNSKEDISSKIYKCFSKDYLGNNSTWEVTKIIGTCFGTGAAVFSPCGGFHCDVVIVQVRWRSIFQQWRKDGQELLKKYYAGKIRELTGYPYLTISGVA